MRLLLDTSVLIDSNTLDLSSSMQVAISVISLSELHRGVLGAGDPLARAHRLRRLTAIESALDPLPVTASVARIHGAMGAAVVAAGRQPRRRAMDLLIAATAADVGATLVTLNLDDFAGLEHFLPVRAPTTLDMEPDGT